MGLRRSPTRLRPDRRPGRPECPSRSTRALPTTRRRPSAEARHLWWLVDRPNVLIKIPATEPGLPAIAAAHRRGHQRQRHADLLARALRRRSWTPISPAWSRRNAARPTCRRSSIGRLVLRQPRRHRDRQAAGQDRAPTEASGCGARPAIANAQARLSSATRRSFAADRWAGLDGHGRELAAAAVGLDRRQGPGLRRHDVRGRAGRARTRSNTMPEATLNAVEDHGVITGDAVRGSYATAAEGPRRSRRDRHRLQRRGESALRYERCGRSSRTPWKQLLEGVQAQLTPRGRPDPQGTPGRRRSS